MDPAGARPGAARQQSGNCLTVIPGVYRGQRSTTSPGNSGVSRATAPGSSHLLLLMVPTREASCPIIEFAGQGSIQLNRRNLYLLDDSKPYVCCSPEPMDRMAVWIARDALKRRVPLASVVNRPIPLQGAAALLAAYIQELIRIGPSTLSQATAAVVSEQVVDLTALALRGRLGIKPQWQAITSTSAHPTPARKGTACRKGQSRFARLRNTYVMPRGDDVAVGALPPP